MKKKRRLRKRVIIIFIIFILIIFIGGIVMIINNNHELKDIDSDKDIKNNYNSEDDKKVNNNLEKAPDNYSDFSKLEDGEYLTKTGYTLVIKDGIAYVDNNIIVNKTYALSADYKPVDPYQEVTYEKCNNCLNKEVMKAFNLMQSDAKALGLNIYISSGYRSYNYQNNLYNNYSAVSGTDQADTYSARPGHSEHQTGFCFDLNSISEDFAYTDEGIWVHNNAYLYGFIIRYPKGKENITGYIYESWHLRYVGKELAAKLYNNGDWITLEEYYGLSSSY